MAKIIGVRFRRAGKIYYFSPRDLEIEVGQNVIVETVRGVEYGHVCIGVREVSDDSVVQPLKEVLRVATPEDDEREESNRSREEEAKQICREKIEKHGLEMKLVAAEYTFDNNKLLFYFTADGRVDFRELVKDLAAVFKTRIELRQIGVRDETKIRGGIGICGRSLCCSVYLSDFVPVSIRMAKDQNLSLNTTKISGVCGRLMKKKKNEQETGMKGEVAGINVLRQTVKVLITMENDEKEIREYAASQLRLKARRRKDRKGKDAKDGQKGSERTASKGGESGNPTEVDPDLAALEEIEKKDRKEGKTAL